MLLRDDEGEAIEAASSIVSVEAQVETVVDADLLGRRLFGFVVGELCAEKRHAVVDVATEAIAKDASNTDAMMKQLRDVALRLPAEMDVDQT